MRFDSKLMKKDYTHELLPIVHRILDVSGSAIHLQQIPNWPRDSLPKSPMIQKLGLIVIPILYPWWCRDLEINYEQFGPYSPVIATVFNTMLDQGVCSVVNDTIDVLPVSFEESSTFPEITELFIQHLLRFSTNPILSQFETIELFSIISVEQEALFRSMRILRRMTVIPFELRSKLLQRVLYRMSTIPHLQAFMLERGNEYTKKFLTELIDTFYEGLQESVV